MALIVSSDVVALIPTDRDVTGFIATADLIVTEALVGKGLSNERLKQVEAYLAAHFAALAIERGGLRLSKIGDSTDLVDLKTGTGLNLTRFGQQAIMLDSSGTLKNSFSTKLAAQFRVV